MIFFKHLLDILFIRKVYSTIFLMNLLRPPATLSSHSITQCTCRKKKTFFSNYTCKFSAHFEEYFHYGKVFVLFEVTSLGPVQAVEFRFLICDL